MNWRDHAACDGLAPKFDAIVAGESAYQRSVRHRAAIALCRTCPVITACAADVVLGVDEGVRGGQLLPEAGAVHMARWRAAQNRQEPA